MSRDNSDQYPFPRVVEIDLEDLVSSGCLDGPARDREHLEARAVLALSGDPISAPSFARAAQATPPPLRTAEVPTDLPLAVAPSSPDIPLLTQLQERRAQNAQLEESDSSDDIPLKIQAEERARILKQSSSTLPEPAEPETYFASLIPDLEHPGAAGSHPAGASGTHTVAASTAPSRESVRAAKRLWRGWKQTNRRKVKEALERPLSCSGVRLRAFADGEQAEWTSARPPEGGPYVPCSGSLPHVLVDEDNIPLAWVFPGFLGTDAHRILFRDLQQFAEDVEISPDKPSRAGADANTRNKRSSYKRSTQAGERSGCFQLVNLWGAVGHPDGQLGPATDVVGGRVRDFNATAKLMDELRVVSKRIDHIIQCVDPAQHAELHKARDELRQQFPAYKLLSQLDPSYFHGRSLIFNRATPRHRDMRDKKFAWTPVLTLGNYTCGTFRVLNHDIDYMPGTLILLRGAVFLHEVTYEGGARVCIAHFTHEYVVNRTSVRALPLMTAAEVAASLAAYTAEHAASALPKNNNAKKARRRARHAAAASGTAL